ncbi:hypothetical protein NKW43_10055 [Gluconobacter albidus]|uniref:phage fiber-tail adaptor protein n=1 Tax=Gluconobacter albidus TaxID=318683 RepID=UPI0020A1CE6C|nr:hypothetical protein [Gluconobacter albidus]MCP1274020.1 hypothetical protein [Gluconobacter albidus]
MTTVHNLTPSPLRTVTLQSCTGLFAQVMWTPKASADCLDYVLDFSTPLAGTGDTLASIASATVTTAQGSSYDLTIMWSAVAGTQMVVFLASGQPNTAQKILFEITTQQGRVYSVMAVLQITALTVATAPPSDFPADTLTNGKVLIAGVEALPSGYSSNGRVVMATEADAPVGTPSFESVTAGTYSGDGSGLDVTSGAKTQTIAEWIAALSSGGAQGVGIKAINLTQDPVVAGQPSTVTLTATLTDGTTTAPATFEVPSGSTGAAGAPGIAGDPGATGPQGVGIASVAVSQGVVSPGQSSTVTLTATMTNGATAPGVSFDTPAGSPGEAGAPGAKGDTGAPGSDANVTAANIKTALGYTPAATATQCTAAELPTNGTVGDAVFCTDATSGLQGQTFPAEGCYLFWNGVAWVDYMGFAYTTGNFPGGTAHITAQKISASYEIDIASGYVFGYFAFQSNAVLDMQNQTTITSSTGNTLATVKGNTNTTQNAVSALAWAKDARGPGEAAGAGTGRWIYKNTAGVWCDFATGTEALV